MSDAPLLAVRGLSTYYGHSQALFDVDLVAGQRGAVAVLGRNGAGKTTLLKTIVGELKPRQGQIAFEGRDDTRMPTEQRVRRGLGYVPQEHGVFGRLTVRENLAVGAVDAARPRRRRRGPHPVSQARPAAEPARRHLSGGERKMLAVSRALLVASEAAAAR